MDSAELKSAQAPLKARYREEPTAALVTLHADGSLAAEGVACSVETGRRLVEAGLHPATGGSGLLACSGDMLLEALVACAVPVGFTAIRVRFELEHDEDDEAIAKLLELTERYCVVFQTLTGGVSVELS